MPGRLSVRDHCERGSGLPTLTARTAARSPLQTPVETVSPDRAPRAARATRGDRSPAIDRASLRGALHRAASTVDRHAAELTRLDAVLGDGDHGDNLAIGFRAVMELVDRLPEETPPGELLRAGGHCLVATVGGASGPLYGTACIEAGFQAGAAARLDPELAAAMLSAAAAGLARRGRCAIGDKTILDTLQPAADALAAGLASGASPVDAQRAALRAARQGMRATAGMVARRGLALRLGDRSVGHRDPGAVSCFLLLLALADR